MRGRVNRRDAAVVALVVQRRRRNRAQRIVNGGEARASLGCLRLARIADGFFVGRPLTVRAKGCAEGARLGGQSPSAREEPSSRHGTEAKNVTTARAAVAHWCIPS